MGSSVSTRLKAWFVCTLCFVIFAYFKKSGDNSKLTRQWITCISDRRETINQKILSTISESDSIVQLHSSYDTDFNGFDVRNAKLSFLPEFKNPCWLEPHTDGNVYAKNLFFSTQAYPKRIWKSKFKNLHKGGVTYTHHTLCNSAEGCRIRCLPYFMLLGVHKSATTDLYNRMEMHPQIFSSIEKEVYWWNQLRFKKMLGASLGDYADLFDDAVEEIKALYTNNNVTEVIYHPEILGEYTAMTFFDMSYWRQDPVNKELSKPLITTPYDVHKVNPNIKLILLLRNPTERLYSHYNYFTDNVSPEDFHTRVLGSIWWWKLCTETKGLPRRNCVYGAPPDMPYVYDEVGKPYMWWSSRFNYSGELRTGMYPIHAKEWLKVFPRESMLFVKMEEYSAYTAETFVNQIFPFLGVDKPEEEIMKHMTTKTALPNKSYRPMLNETRRVLEQFYRPYNEELAQLLGDQKWLWRS